jgi:hypothetical protein
MAAFIVSWEEVYAYAQEVEADTKEEAIDMVMQGMAETEPKEMGYKETVEDTVYAIKV